MQKKIIVQDSFLVTGIMCYQGCGETIQGCLNNCFAKCQQEKVLPLSACLSIDAEPQTLGVHRIFIHVECDESDFKKQIWDGKKLSARFKEHVESIGFEVVSNGQPPVEKEARKTNWLNFLVNSLTITTILILTFAFPPSLLLTIGLTVLSCFATAFTARNYLIHFYQNIRNKNLFNMTSTVTLGWFLSLVHTLYHSISMPLASSFSMTFMNFIMPPVLMVLINGMDEIKRIILNRSKKIHLQGMSKLFPQMMADYAYYELAEQQKIILNQWLLGKSSVIHLTQFLEYLPKPIQWGIGKKNSLKKDMLIYVPQGACFPVDCTLVDKSTIVDASLLTGEMQQQKLPFEGIPAGAVNLGEAVIVYALQSSYNSTINKILFRSNRDRKKIPEKKNPNFAYFYMGLIVLGIIASVAIPAFLGVLTIPLLLQNSIGILFGICPCTLVIAHQLPTLISTYQRNKQGVVLRDEASNHGTDDIHTVVFDKTGTLTTGNSQVDSTKGIYAGLWERIYLLEKNYGAGHPIAKAICRYFEAKVTQKSMISHIVGAEIDTKNRGLSAIVQGKTIHIGSAEYFRQWRIEIPVIDTKKMEQGLSQVYVAEDNVYQGIIYIKHEVRPNVLSSLKQLKKEGKKIFMLTGDASISAKGFNIQNDALFDEGNIHAAQTPQNKETFMQQLMSAKDINPKGVWFVGDGLNDASCARIVSEKGGVSCAMTSDTKAAFFTDISLNGSLDYLFTHSQFNGLTQKSITQNKGILLYSVLVFLVFIISFSILGVALSPIIPLTIMLSTTLFVLFNSYRVSLAMEVLSEKDSSWTKKLFASDLSIGLLIGASFLLMCSIVIATAVTGGLALPLITFTAGVAAAISSSCFIGGIALSALFLLLAVPNMMERKSSLEAEELPVISQLTKNKQNTNSRSISLTVVNELNNIVALKEAKKDFESNDECEEYNTNTLSYR